MRGYFLIVFFLVIVFIAVVYGAPSNSEGSDPEVELTPSSELPAPNSLLPLRPKRDTTIIAAPDGMVHLVERKSREVLWSFKSGDSIYSSYHALPDYQRVSNNVAIEDDNFYIDCGEDWKLYLHVNGFKKVELPFSAEEILKRTPYPLASGIMLGSKKTTVSIIDANTGNGIHTFRSDVFPLEGDAEVGQNPILPKKDEALNVLYLMRTDYALKYTSSKTGKVLWYLMFADFEASQQCKPIDSFFGGFSDPEDHLNYGVCPTNLAVHRVRDSKSLESLFPPDRPQNSLSGDGLLSIPQNALPGAGSLSLPQNALSGDRALSLLENALSGGVAPSSPQSDDITLYLPPSTNKSEIMLQPRGDIGQLNRVMESDATVQPYNWTSVVQSTLVVFIAAISFVYAKLRKKWKLQKQATDAKLQAVTSKKKKSRKSGLIKNSTRSEESKKNIHNDDIMNGVSSGSPEIGKNEKFLELSLTKYSSLMYHRKIGKLLVSNTEIAKGSNGTIILEGIYDGRPVAVKRLVQTHHEVALKEIQNLIASDQHPNIVRWYGVEYDQDFVYLSLERCTCSLYEFILSCSSSCQSYPLEVQWSADDKENFPLWKSNGYPSPHLLKLMRDMVSGLAHLHELGIVHRDLKPQNVLVVKERSICAKLSDMGISKHLTGDMSSLTKNSTGSGSSGWQAPEQLRHERQTRAVDLFSLGCVLFFGITGGKHPFGDNFERDVNIVNNQKDLFLIENIPEAADLIGALLHPEPDLRPRAVEVLHHPFFWDSEMRLSFLRDASDRVELEDREKGSKLLEALESVKTVALGGLWNEKMDTAFMNDIGRYRRYKYDSVRDLLRVIRNKLNHYRELSKEIQGILGQVPEGFDSYFSIRFPRLVIEVYKVFRMYCIEEDIFKKYFRGNQI